ncbi:hypothetical protein [Caldivirga maquilingensis]|uniref:Uncharacterized protein n=1 Tax=Caldivirga maquilingensis (strain ATCC 700844 / DSM 13496 / JCM 10307 / IC-167) TaxID=397948 RepID=A8MCH4_CALMQ|nr:hypothetical protein [Caldivirga maquilingensis]ABW01480.1 hypothetical protein Cmaq_0640 [Caldivirga maquilingensis IC-167]
MIDQGSVKDVVKGFFKSRGIINIRYIKVNANEREGVVHVGIYIEKPISLTILIDLTTELSSKFKLSNWLIYAPHGGLIRLTGSVGK